ncbi:MAG: hypothetical protein D6729_07330 [Deltaproteobacteria bacterium]|nr:MAG: hypothetical protein D6729_07330 [Deltaproteobacteria bacterium]
MQQAGAKHHIITFVFLFGLWVVLSGKLDAVHLGMGVGAAAFVTWLSGGLLYSNEGDGRRRWLTDLPWPSIVFLYLPWLALEIVKANLQVLQLVLGPRGLLQPRLVRYRPRLKSEVALVTFANSITLTPGTVTVDIEEDGTFVVHAIDAATAAGLESGEMEERIAAVFREALPPRGPEREGGGEEAGSAGAERAGDGQDATASGPAPAPAGEDPEGEGR